MRSWLSKKPALVREGSVSTDRRRRHRSSVPLLPRYGRSSRDRSSLPGSCQAYHSVATPNPHVGPRYSSSNPRIQNLRSWPVAGFEAVRIYYVLEEDAMHIIRILHGKRDVRRILRNE